MQTSSRYREPGGGYVPKRGHVTQLSISDDSHHVTEAIGYMYGDEDNYDRRRQSRPLSFVSSPLSESIEQSSNMADSEGSGNGKSREAQNRSISNERSKPNGQIRPTMGGPRMNSFERESSPLSPTLSMHKRTPSDTATATTSFPLNDIDYESNPAAVAQELSNLQALRRMSMDVTATGDPDLPAFSGIPTIAPSASADEDDSSRLFWVPARIHPELAPKEFKSFLESKAEQIKRRSGELSQFSSASSQESISPGSSLRRKKSMLSRQIDNRDGKAGDGYTDGAERLERKRSLKQNGVAEPTEPNLLELEALVNDPRRLQRLSLTESVQKAQGGEVPADQDMPILPAAPPGHSLRRSTRTTYRRGSLKKGERVPLSHRARKAAETDTEESPQTSPTAATYDAAIGQRLGRVQTDPTPVPPVPPLPTEEKRSSENFSRPNFSRPGPRGRGTPKSATTPSISFDSILQQSSDTGNRSSAPPTAKTPHLVVNSPPSHLRSNSFDSGVPEVVETPPSPEEQRHELKLPQESIIPERRSSHDPPPSLPPQGPLPREPGMASKRPALVKQPSPTRLSQSAGPGQSQNQGPTQTLENMAAHPSPLPGNSTRTDSLSFIPTLTEDKKADNRSSKASKAEPRKSSWGWFSSNEEKEKEKRKEEEAKHKRKTLSKPVDKSHDNTRLDVLQTSIDGGHGPRGRESLVLDRNELRLEDERKKESARKNSGESKKEKDGLFSSLFGGKKKSEQDSKAKKHTERHLSPDPPHRDLKPDIDYNWTRFSILEERAIYRMAHIKLANPRRALYSQVLLSNFMYSYLAKVQQMHPQMQLPTSAMQKKQNEEQEKKKKQAQAAAASQQSQPDEYSQYQRYQDVQQQHATQQQQQQQQQMMQNQQGQHQQTYNEDYDDYEEDHEDRHRPSSRGSKQENGNMYSNHRSARQSQQPQHQSGHHYQMQQHQQQQQQQQHGSQYDDERIGDYDNEMW